MASLTDTPLDDGVRTIKKALKTMPLTPGVYRMLDETGTALYVGKAKNLKKRVTSYTRPLVLPRRLQRMIAETRAMEIVTTHTEVEALLLESNLIKKLEPKYNILLRDDKSYSYILLTADHTFPQIKKHRGAQKRKGQYFGPFASADAVKRTIIDLQKAFLLRNCSDSYFANRDRPCLQYHIKQCSAPCVGNINEKDYDQLVESAVEFLQGKSTSVQQDLAKKMQIASDSLEFELAAQYRNRLRALSQIQSQQAINVNGMEEHDVMAVVSAGGQVCIQHFVFRHNHLFGTQAYFPRHTKDDSVDEVFTAFLAQFYVGRFIPKYILTNQKPDLQSVLEDAFSHEKGSKVKILSPSRGKFKPVLDHAKTNAKQALMRHQSVTETNRKILGRLQEVFTLTDLPQRIEVYDNSHISGSNPVGVMVVATPEGFDKKSYRKFNIKDKTIQAGDDYAMMREVLLRRLKKSAQKDKKFTALPDLILVDGGKGQLSAATDILQELNLDIPIAAIAKGPDRNAGRETFYFQNQAPLNLPENDTLLFYIQRLRDEAHRFAIGSHKSRRKKEMVKSLLDDVPGIGPKRKKTLLHHFGSAKEVARAGVQDLMMVEGISKSVAESIYYHFHNQ